MRRALLLVLLTLAACGGPEPAPFDVSPFFEDAPPCRDQLATCAEDRDPAACLLELCRAEDGSTCALACGLVECQPACESLGGGDVCDADPCVAIQCADVSACF